MKIEYYDIEDKEYLEQLLNQQKRERRKDIISLLVVLLIPVVLFIFVLVSI